MEIVDGAPSSRMKRVVAEDPVFQGVEFDSRQIQGGELFVALPGQKTRGELFVDEAFKRGAALALVADEKLVAGEPARIVLVKDSLQALWKLANWWRRELKVPLVGITGSVGKTTVKEMCAALLLQQGPGIYSLRSHNNHVGVPYTLCRLGREHEWAVVEIGMNHAGEVRALAQIAEPDVAVITAVEPAHIEALGSLEAIARAKLEIVEGLPQGRPLIVGGEYRILLEALDSLAGRYAVKRFGTKPGFEACVADVVVLGLTGISFKLGLEGETMTIEMSVLGRQNALNAACAALAAKTLKPALTARQIKVGLESFKAPLMRVNWKERSSGQKIVDDSYNANPASMRALLELARALKWQGNKIGLVLGDMLELGSFAEMYHREIGRQAADLEPHFLISVGQHSAFLLAEAERRGIKTFQAGSPEEAASIASGQDFDILLVKASRLVGLDRTVKALLEVS